VDSERDPLQESEARLLERIRELRARARGESEPLAEAAGAPAPAAAVAPVAGALPDLRTLLARAETHVDELRATASTLEESLPLRVERAVERALEGHADARGSAELAELLRTVSAQVEQITRDLLAERLGRLEDLEMMLELITTGMTQIRADMAATVAAVERVGRGVGDVLVQLDQPLQVTLERQQAAGVQDLFRPTSAAPTMEATPPDRPGSEDADH
jgi:hypothetical protein